MVFTLKLIFHVIALIVVVIKFDSVLCTSDSNKTESDNSLIPIGVRHILTDEVASFEIPLDVQKKFIYYLSGFDDENRPIWVVEIGKWDMQAMIEGGNETYRFFDLVILQAVYRFVNSTQIKSTEEEPVNQVILLVDMENFELKQLASIPTVQYILKRFGDFLPVFVKAHEIFIVNGMQFCFFTLEMLSLLTITNYVADSLLKILRPVLGKEFEKLTIYGNNKSKWAHKILRKLPRSQLPEWYGGVKDFVPIQVFG